MQGIKITLDQNSVKLAKEQFNTLIKDLQGKANVNINLNQIVQQIKNIENVINSTNKKLHIFDANQLKQDDSNQA
jgi:hypothetical protein